MGGICLSCHPTANKGILLSPWKARAQEQYFEYIVSLPPNLQVSSEKFADSLMSVLLYEIFFPLDAFKIILLKV